MTLLLGGALRLTEYDYFQEQIVKFIVLKVGSAASTGGDREFTDWNALASFVDRFLEPASLLAGEVVTRQSVQEA
jgi:menaquinone-dependent protoporphyrinogen oxidase